MAKVELIETATVRRRRYSRDEKLALLSECAQSNMSAIARRHGIARSLLQCWKRELRGVAPGASSSGASAFVRLEAADGRPRPSSNMIRIVSKGGLLIELPAAADLKQVAAFVLLPEGGCSDA